MFIILYLLFPTLFSNRFIDSFQYITNSSLEDILFKINDVDSGRLTILKNSILVFLDNPIFGTGLTDLRWFHLPKLGVIPEAGVMGSHNILIEILAEQGLFGFSLLTLIALFFIKSNTWTALFVITFFILSQFFDEHTYGFAIFSIYSNLYLLMKYKNLKINF